MKAKERDHQTLHRHRRERLYLVTRCCASQVSSLSSSSCEAKLSITRFHQTKQEQPVEIEN